MLLFLSSKQPPMVSSQCPDTGIQHFTQSHQERCILHNTFMLTNPVSNQNSWIPVSGHWDDTIGTLG
ncbi:hypothetical protein [Wolbachia endosymbiont of Zaprionus taronus]|uniref:hypothetical protein n=1 Tax=Wolbachia endosymbiont of Zaprionus taronus TaxID=2603208 RepID=UPI0029492FA0|nr:hypothetical protein [Wolbachia endosymbiont of Zaprionus taronus]MDV6248522.1 hypothetical protein [Wolbachia endosymbiont of Zaprionus taronus]